MATQCSGILGGVMNIRSDEIAEEFDLIVRTYCPGFNPSEDYDEDEQRHIIERVADHATSAEVVQYAEECIKGRQYASR